MMTTTAFDLLHLMLPNATTAELSALQVYFQPLKKQVWQKGHYFFRPDEDWERIILIESGLIRCFYLEEDREINLRFLRSGSVALPFSSLAETFIDEQKILKSNEYIQAVSTLTGYSISVKYLLQQTKYPEFRQLGLELAARHYLSIERRLRMIQNLKAKARYQKFLAWMPEEIVQNMPNHFVASYLGIAPESLSRLKV